MKKLHLVTGNDDLRPSMTYIQVLNGFCYATNGHVLVKIPISEVFGPDIVLPNEEIYFSGDQWKKQNFSKAIRIIRENNIFKAFDKKGLLIGIIEAKTNEVFKNEVGRFPECEIVIPINELDNINNISFNHKLYFDIVECFNLEVPLFYMEFRGEKKGIMIKNSNGQSEGIGLLMPLARG